MFEVNLYQKALKMALKVRFLKGNEELKAYTRALYGAMVWGKNVK